MTSYVRILRIGCIIFLWISLFVGLLYLPVVFVWSNKRSINVCAWSGTFDASDIDEFERATGIRVNLSYYDSNDELLLKLQAGAHDAYDLIIPSDYTVSQLIQAGKLQPLDHAKLPFLNELDAQLLGHYFDPDNRYSLPFEWALFGIGYDTGIFTAHDFDDWSAIFDPEKHGHRLVMVNDPFVAAPLASIALYGNANGLTRQTFGAIQTLLKHQEPWVTAYIDTRPDYFLASRTCALAVGASSYMVRSMQKNAHIAFAVPKSGTLMTIENCCVPVGSKKVELVYTFLTYVYQERSMLKRFERSGLFPPVQVLPTCCNQIAKTEYLRIRGAVDATVQFFKTDTIRTQKLEYLLYSLWLDIKQ